MNVHMNISRIISTRGAHNLHRTLRSRHRIARPMDPGSHAPFDPFASYFRGQAQSNAFSTVPAGLNTSISPIYSPNRIAHTEEIQITSNTPDVQVAANALQTVSIVDSWGRPRRPHERPEEAVPKPQPDSPGMGSPSAREKRDEKIYPSMASGGIPDPTNDYLTASNVVSQSLQQPQNLLVVIDLNGTLLFRPSRRQPTKFIARPNTHPFLKYCINTFTVVIWSSAKPENVKNMCDAILTPDLRKQVVAIWGRDKFGLSKADYVMRVQCYKRLTKLWSDNKVAKSHPQWAEGGRWDQTNTVLIDDSLEKGRSEPFNLVEIPEFFGDEMEIGEFLPQVHDFLNHLSMHSNVSACMRARPFNALLAPP